MKNRLYLLFILFECLLMECSQKTANPLVYTKSKSRLNSHSLHMDTVVLNKWKRAVINLEGATDKQSAYERFEKEKELKKLFRQQKITEKQFIQESNKLSSEARRDVRYTGTAIFLLHNSRHYLITARHVLWDNVTAKHILDREVKDAQRWPESQRHDIIESAKERVLDLIFPIIFRVPSLDEVIEKVKNSQDPTPLGYLMSLNAGTKETHSYSFSETELDLAIISLNHRSAGSDFLRELLENGYKPIGIDDISEGPDFEGEDVFTVGYPGSTATLGSLQLTSEANPWGSNSFSLPVFSFGKVAMLHSMLPFFWTDISIYPGNSGGPLIANGKLAGIVSSQAVTLIDGTDINIRIPFGRIIKSSHIRELLQTQIQKDEFVQSLREGNIHKK